MRRHGRVALVLVLLLGIGLTAPAWAGGTDTPGVSPAESTTVGTEAPASPDGWDLLNWLGTIAQLVMPPLGI